MTKRIEQDLQRYTVEALALLYPAGLVIHIPNGGKRGKIEAAILKGMGVKAGAPDLLIIRPYGRVAWIEMKASKDEKPSKAQVEFHAELAKRGHEVAVVYDLAQLEPLVKRWMISDATSAKVLGDFTHFYDASSFSSLFGESPEKSPR